MRIKIVVMWRLNSDRVKYVGYIRGGARLLSSPKSAAEMGRTWATPTVRASDRSQLALSDKFYIAVYF